MKYIFLNLDLCLLFRCIISSNATEWNLAICQRYQKHSQFTNISSHIFLHWRFMMHTNAPLQVRKETFFQISPSRFYTVQYQRNLCHKSHSSSLVDLLYRVDLLYKVSMQLKIAQATHAQIIIWRSYGHSSHSSNSGHSDHIGHSATRA